MSPRGRSGLRRNIARCIALVWPEVLGGESIHRERRVFRERNGEPRERHREHGGTGVGGYTEPRGREMQPGQHGDGVPVRAAPAQRPELGDVTVFIGEEYRQIDDKSQDFVGANYPVLGNWPVDREHCVTMHGPSAARRAVLGVMKH